MVVACGAAAFLAAVAGLNALFPSLRLSPLAWGIVGACWGIVGFFSWWFANTDDFSPVPDELIDALGAVRKMGLADIGWALLMPAILVSQVWVVVRESRERTRSVS